METLKSPPMILSSVNSLALICHIVYTYQQNKEMKDILIQLTEQMKKNTRRITDLEKKNKLGDDTMESLRSDIRAMENLVKALPDSKQEMYKLQKLGIDVDRVNQSMGDMSGDMEYLVRILEQHGISVDNPNGGSNVPNSTNGNSNNPNNMNSGSLGGKYGRYGQQPSYNSEMYNNKTPYMSEHYSNNSDPSVLDFSERSERGRHYGMLGSGNMLHNNSTNQFQTSPLPSHSSNANNTHHSHISHSPNSHGTPHNSSNQNNYNTSNSPNISNTPNVPGGFSSGPHYQSSHIGNRQHIPISPAISPTISPAISQNGGHNGGNYGGHYDDQESYMNKQQHHDHRNLQTSNGGSNGGNVNNGVYGNNLSPEPNHHYNNRNNNYQNNNHGHRINNDLQAPNHNQIRGGSNNNQTYSNVHNDVSESESNDMDIIAQIRNSTQN